MDLAVPPAPPAPRCDVAVVGGGLTGLSTALYLARAGANAVVLEAGPLGAGASGRSGGIALEGTAAGVLPGADDCLPFLTTLLAETGIDCGLTLPGCRELTHRPSPDPRPPGWPDDGGTLVTTDLVPGGTLDPAALVSGLAQAARAAGAAIHASTPVRELVPTPGGVEVRFDDGTLRAGHAVVALGAFPVARLLRRPISLRSAVTLALCTEPLDGHTLHATGLRGGLPFYTTDVPYVWGRTLADGRAIFGTGLLFAGDGGSVATIDLRTSTARTALDRLERRVRGFHPTLADVVVETRWGGPVAFTPDRLPLCARLPRLPVLLAGGFAGHGIVLAVRAGEHLAAAITDGRPLPAWGALDRH